MHWSLSIPPENIPLVFWCFQGVYKETSGMKWIIQKVNYTCGCCKENGTRSDGGNKVEEAETATRGVP